MQLDEILIRSIDWKSPLRQKMLAKMAKIHENPLTAEMALNRVNPDSTLGQKLRMSVSVNANRPEWLRKNAIKGLDLQFDGVRKHVENLLIREPNTYDVSDTARKLLHGEEMNPTFIKGRETVATLRQKDQVIKGARLTPGSGLEN